ISTLSPSWARSLARRHARLPRMTTIEQLTGAEEVEWDLSDLYESPDDPKLEEEVAGAERGAAAFRERYYEGAAGLSAIDHVAAQVPAASADRAGRADHDREDGLGLVVVVAPVLRAAQRPAGEGRRRGHGARDDVVPAVLGRSGHQAHCCRGRHRIACPGS